MTAKEERAGVYPMTGRHSHLELYGPGPVPYESRVIVRECCEARGLSVYQVARSGLATGLLDEGTVYRLARGDTTRIDLFTLEALAGIIHALSGQPVGIGDLLALEGWPSRQVKEWSISDLNAWNSGQR